jgi:hypothetical protein
MDEAERKLIKISEIRKFVVDKVSKTEDDVQLCRVFEILSGNTVTHAGESGSEEVEVMIHKRF